MHRDLIARLTAFATDAQRSGAALIGYAVALFAASLLLVVSWAPLAIVAAATVVAVAWASAGVAVMRRSAWRRAIVTTSCALHVAVAAVWSVMLVSL